MVNSQSSTPIVRFHNPLRRAAARLALLSLFEAQGLIGNLLLCCFRMEKQGAGHLGGSRLSSLFKHFLGGIEKAQNETLVSSAISTSSSS